MQIIYTMLYEFSFFSFLVTCYIRNVDLFTLKIINIWTTICLAEAKYKVQEKYVIMFLKHRS